MLSIAFTVKGEGVDDRAKNTATRFGWLAWLARLAWPARASTAKAPTVGPVLLAAAVTLCWAATALSGEGAPVDGAERATMLDLFFYGLYINVINGALLFIATFFFCRTLLLTRSGRTVPAGLLKQVLDDLASGDVESSLTRTERHPSLLARTIHPGLKLHDHPAERIHTAMEGAGRRAVGGVRQGISYLSNIGALAPMLGLLGTVLGLTEAFHVIAASATGGSKAMEMAASIGRALSTTAVGMMVSIPCMAAYYWSLSRLGRIGDDVEIAAEEVLAALVELKGGARFASATTSEGPATVATTLVGADREPVAPSLPPASAASAAPSAAQAAQAAGTVRPGVTVGGGEGERAVDPRRHAAPASADQRVD